MERQKPLISVLMPVFNAAPFVAAAIESILRQAYDHFELLIADDGSADGSYERISAFTDVRIRTFRQETNQGYLRTVNALAKEARGIYFAFQDADDVSHPLRLQLQVEALERGVDLVGTNYALIDRRGHVFKTKNVEDDPAALANALQKGNPFQKPSIVFRREVYDEIGLFRDEFLELGNISEDFDWILRVSERFRVANINHAEPLYLYRSVPTAMTKSFQSVDQLFGADVALRLAQERRASGTDSIARGDIDSLKRFIADLRKPYEQDGSLFYHRKAAALIYAGLTTDAIAAACKAVATHPGDLKNYRLLQFCIRKSLLGL